MAIGPNWDLRIIASLSRSRSVTSSIPQTRAALSTMASRTGCTSVGERLMMPRDLRRCRLMLQRFAQFRVALLQLFEQPHVLDGNDRLASESFEQYNMSVRKWTHFDASDVDHANRRSFSD